MNLLNKRQEGKSIVKMCEILFPVMETNGGIKQK